MMFWRVFSIFPDALSRGPDPATPDPTRTSITVAVGYSVHQVFKVDYLELSAEILRWDFKGL